MGAKIKDFKSALFERRKINPTTGCWEWILSVGNHGYAEVQWGTTSKVLVHRLSYSIFVGEIEVGMCVLHKCDNRKCFNPKHLFMGTKKDNHVDMVSKGRSHNHGLTHCKMGHEYTPENIKMTKKGRECGECRRKRNDNRKNKRTI